MADYLTEEEQLERLKTWWAANGAKLLASLALVVAAVVGWRWYQASSAASLEAASDLYESYLAAADERSALAERIDAEIPGTSYQAFTFMHRAKEALQEDDIDAAIGLLQQVIDAGVPVPLKDLARIRQARLRQQQGDSDAALALLAEVRGTGFRWQVQELKGDIHLALGQRAEAQEAYASAQREAPEGRELPILEMKVRDTAAADAS